MNLYSLAMVNKEFYSIINSKSFIKNAVEKLEKKLGIDKITAALFLTTPVTANATANWLRQRLTLVDIDKALDNAVKFGRNLSDVKFIVHVRTNLNNSEALAKAAGLNKVSIVKFLLTKDPSAEQKNKALLNAIVIALIFEKDKHKKENIETIIKLLIESGADVNTQQKGKSALSIAQDRHLTNIIEILKGAGAKENPGTPD